LLAGTLAATRGVGLCRTEHMFLGDRRVLIERVILAETAAQREEALDALRPLQRADFIDLLEAHGRPTGDGAAAGPAAA